MGLLVYALKDRYKLYIITVNYLSMAQTVKFAFSRSEDGLATGLDSLQTSCQRGSTDRDWLWNIPNERTNRRLTRNFPQEMNFHPVFLSGEKQIESTTKGYSNSAIWRCTITFMYTFI